MAINNWNNFIAAGTQTPWYANAFEDALKGYKIAKEPEKMQQETNARDLANKLKQLDVEHKPKEYELDDRGKSLANSLKAKANEHYEENYDLDRQLKQANINKANRAPELKGVLSQAFQMRNNLDPKDPNYEHDKKTLNRYIDNFGNKNGSAPVTQPGEGVKIDLPEGKQGYIPGLGNLKKGWQVVKDDKGNDIGVNVPMTDDQVKQYKAKEKFDIIYPFINKSLSEYSGQGSWERFTRDAQNYNKNQEAKKNIDNYFAAKNLISIGSTTENARIGGHATNVQLGELKKTLDKSEVFKKLETGSGFVLPQKYAKNSGDIFKNYLDKVEKAAKTNIPAYEFRALNPKDNNNDSHDLIYNPVTGRLE
jgi:hypothetical protein